MPEYLAPGVFVEEVSFRAKSIEGVGTSVAAVVGPTRFGPLRGTPEVVTSFGEFTRIYGDIRDLNLGGASVLNHTAIAAKAFFDGGGKQLFVSRVANYALPATGLASVVSDDDAITFSSRFPGAMGNFTLELEWRDTENLLVNQVSSELPAEGEETFLIATGLTNAVRSAGIAAQFPDAHFPLGVRALVRRTGDHLVIVDNRCELTTADGVAVSGADLRADGDPADAEGRLMVAGLVAGNGVSFSFAAVSAKNPSSGPLTANTPAVLNFSAETDLSAYTGADHWGDLTTLRGRLNAAGTAFEVDGGGLNAGVDEDITLPLQVLAAAQDTVQSLTVQRDFDISVHAGDADAAIVYTYGNLSIDPDADNSIDKVMAANPDKRYDRLSSPVSCTLGADIDQPEEVFQALYALFDEDALNPGPLEVKGPSYLISLAGGSDGNLPSAVHYGGVVDEVNGSSGFAALENIEDISIVMTPAAAVDASNHQAVVAEMQKHCLRMRYRVGIVDSREGMTLGEVRAFKDNFDDSRLALYYPWVVISDPRGLTSTISVPPAGFVAGVYANTDVQRGVHKPPANEPVIGALRFAQEINRFQQELLNPNGINCLRSFPGRGHRVWGGRTTSSDPEWKYVNVRRYFLYLERSIDKSTQWVVFEPNGERLWDNVRATVESFLYNEWYNGRLLGSAKTAYFVRCDRSTMTQNDLDNGRLVCEVGVAALKPAEFVIFRIGQKTADA